MFRSHTQLLGTPWPHRRLRRSAAVRRDASSSPSLWSPHSWTDTCLFQLHLSSMMDTFQGLLEIPCFHPSDFCGAKKKRARKAGRSQKNKHANSDHFAWSSIKVFRCTANPSWWASYFPAGMQENSCHILFRETSSEHTGCTVAPSQPCPSLL